MLEFSVVGFQLSDIWNSYQSNDLKLLLYFERFSQLHMWDVTSFGSGNPN